MNYNVQLEEWTMEPTVVAGNSLSRVWEAYVRLVTGGDDGIDDGVPIKERFWVTLKFRAGADFETLHPAMDLVQQDQYVTKMLSNDVDPVLGGSYGYRLRCSYGLDQLVGIADKLTSKPESKAACANLLHPLSSAMERDAGMQRTACMTNLQALLREDQLHLAAHFRSQNAWNAHGNFKGLHALQGVLVDLLERRDVRVGRGGIVVAVNAAHLYERDFAAAEALV